MIRRFPRVAVPAAMIVALILAAVPWAFERASLRAKDEVVQQCLEAGKSVTWSAESGMLSTHVTVSCTDR